MEYVRKWRKMNEMKKNYLIRNLNSGKIDLYG
jgi:hypothetical protein